MEMAKERDEGMKILQKGEYQYDSNTSETSVNLIRYLLYGNNSNRYPKN